MLLVALVAPRQRDAEGFILRVWLRVAALGATPECLDRTTPLMPPQTRIMPTRAGK